MANVKVLHIINSLDIGGAEKLIAESLPIYKDKGIIVELLLLKDINSFLFTLLSTEGITIHSLHSKSVYNPLIILKLIPYFKKFDIIHAHLFPVQYWVAFAKMLSFSRTKLVFTEHSTSNRRWQSKKFFLFDKLSYLTYAKVVCITEEVKTTFASYMPKMFQKTIVINNGINYRRCNDAVALRKNIILSDLKNEDKVLIQVSAFRIEKDQDTLIKSFQYLPEDVKLLLVGEGERKQLCQELVKTLGLTKRIFFLGQRADIPSLFKSVDLSVLCSHWEGFGLVAVESMATGTPVIVSNVSGLADVVGHEQLLFENYNEKKLAEKILQLLEDKELYHSLRQYCIERAKDYDIERMVESYIKLYHGMKKKKVIRVSTVAMGLNILLKGQLRNLNNDFEIIAVSGYDNDLELVKNREGVKVVPLSMERKISLLLDVKALYQLYRLFIIEKPTIVHSLTPKAGLLSMVAAYLARVPIRIHTFTGLIFPSKKGILQKVLILMDKILCLLATNVYPEGQGVRADLLSYRITNKPLKILGNGNINGVNLDFFNPDLFKQDFKLNLRETLGVKNSFVFLFIGRLVGDKGINELVSVFSKLSNNYPDEVKLILVGPLEHHLDPLESETIREIENNESIMALGYKEDIRPYFSIANMFVFPSYREGFPNVVLQSLAMKVPCIVTDINGSNEIIEEKKNGLIVPVKNSEALYNAMENIFRNPSLYDSIKHNTREVIEKKFQQEFVWDCIRSEYNLLIDNV